MNEMEWCLNEFDKHYNELLGENTAICGTKEFVDSILEHNSKYKIKYVLDESRKGKYLVGCYCFSQEQLGEVGIDRLLIAAPNTLVKGIYREIRSECRISHIDVYDLYGKNVEETYKRELKLNLQYPKIQNTDLFKAIDECDVISFDIGNTLFAERYLYFSDFYRNIGKKINDAGINIFDFMQSVANIKERDSFSNLRVIIEVLLVEKKLPMEYLEQIWGIVKEEVKKAFIPRRDIVDALQYAKRQGKKVCIIEDMPEYRLPEPIWRMLLRVYNIGECDDIICSGQFWLHKNEGLYRTVLEKYGDGMRYLHVGDDAETDVVFPEYYGMRTFFIKSPIALFQGFNDLAIDLLDNNIVRDMVEKYLLDVYCDSYTMPEVLERQNRPEMVERASKIKEQIAFWGSCDRLMASNPITYQPVLFDEVASDKEIDSYEKLVFAESENPQVSIVIPVYNQFGYTYNCLRSILEHSGNVSYEVIIADDCSTDHVKELEKVVSGITVLHNKENLKFLLNCNHAVEHARGKYILFLNNDTQVQPDWLNPLVRLVEEDERIGMVGSKLVYPTGQLQEAGGILWKDGSAWNYGHLMNPEEPEYCYVKEADYISGAAIMIRASLWKEIGGFDERFAPAYYEDTDLAFEVRKHGYKVCMQPKSLVVHFEGISNGTDVTTGLKNYQIVNREKFYEKWKDVLREEHFDNGEEVYLAKDRGQTKKQILVVDHYVPNYDKDAGGRCTYMYIKMFVKMGMKVTFIGDNFAKPEPYTTNLEQMGVEVLYGDYYYLHWKEWLAINARYFDFIYLQRPHISIKYMDLVKEYSKAKIFYFAHDLHYVRTYREYQISGNEAYLKESEEWKKIELELFDKTDVGHVVGSYEQEVMQKEFPGKPIRNIPLYIYDNDPECIEKDFSKRRDILFVGGFNHAPNVDAVVWFEKEIFPRLLKKYPDLVWRIVGSNAPEEVKALESEHVVLEGFVSDEKLGELYRTSRMVVVPLRYGAGVKGKIVEAAYYQIPVVTTSIGGEGLDAKMGAFVVEDDADRMTCLIESLYVDYEKLKAMSDAGKDMIHRYFTSEAAEKVLRMDMNI